MKKKRLKVCLAAAQSTNARYLALVKMHDSVSVLYHQECIRKDVEREAAWLAHEKELDALREELCTALGTALLRSGEALEAKEALARVHLLRVEQSTRAGRAEATIDRVRELCDRPTPKGFGSDDWSEGRSDFRDEVLRALGD